VADLIDIPELVKRIHALKAKGVTRVSISYSFERHIQPLQRRVTFGYEYRGPADPSQMAKDVPSMEEIMRRVQHILIEVHSESYVLKLFRAKDLVNLVCFCDLSLSQVLPTIFF
jgi:hypothetical protein